MLVKNINLIQISKYKDKIQNKIMQGLLFQIKYYQKMDNISNYPYIFIFSNEVFGVTHLNIALLS